MSAPDRVGAPAALLAAATLAVGVFALATPAAGAPALGPNDTDAPRVAGGLPNPHADGDRGEYVRLLVPPETNLSGYRLADGEQSVSLPNRTVSGAVAASPEPTAARNLTSATVVSAPGLALANGGERVELRHEGRLLDAATYADAPEGERWRPAAADQFRPRGLTDRAPARFEDVATTAFVLPDAPGPPLSAVRSADRRILLAGYTFGSRRVARALRRAADRGVDVRVLVDAAPVGGTTERQARLLDSLVRAGVDVRVVGGDRSPYAYHHAKYAVADDRAVVLTENWKPAGTGGHSSRGWGVVLDDAGVAGELAGLFGADADAPGTLDWREYRQNATTVPARPARGDYRSRFAPRSLSVDSTTVLVAPDNAQRRLVALVENATESVSVEAASMESGPLLNATVDAARRGVRVRVLLGGADYVRRENRRVVRRLERVADREGLDLRARLADPRSRFEKVHAKAAVVDGDRVVLGSLNWNDHSARRNREVVVVLAGESVADYYARVFRADWRGGRRRLPATLVGALAVAVSLALAVGRRRIRFTRVESGRRSAGGASRDRLDRDAGRSRRRP
jgi:phosphatidylserine/phosphatidylglycerophosphate/cardiolipin synthase-like enzyme